MSPSQGWPRESCSLQRKAHEDRLTFSASRMTSQLTCSWKLLHVCDFKSDYSQTHGTCLQSQQPRVWSNWLRDLTQAGWPRLYNTFESTVYDKAALPWTEWSQRANSVGQWSIACFARAKPEDSVSSSEKSMILLLAGSPFLSIPKPYICIKSHSWLWVLSLENRPMQAEIKWCSLLCHLLEEICFLRQKPKMAQLCLSVWFHLSL